MSESNNKPSPETSEISTCPSLSRTLKDEKGQAICSCRGDVRTVINCAYEGTRIEHFTGGDYNPDDNGEQRFVRASLPGGKKLVHMNKKRLDCARQGVNNIEK